jgi:DNA polymerase elongation subunit (family B)
MSFYTHFHQKRGAIFLRWIDDEGRRKTSVVKDYAPSLYLKTNATEGQFKTLFGEPLKEIKCSSVAEAKEMINNYSDVSGFELFGNTKWDYAYINERWPTRKFDRSKILEFFFDIETEVGDEFPDPVKADQRINVITIYDGSAFRVWSLGKGNPDLMDHRGKLVIRSEFVDEDIMLRHFMHFWTNNYPDVLTGWNSERFDVPYLYNRLKILFGEGFASTLSPVNNVRAFHVDEKTIGYEIKGVEHLDYMQLYKKYVPGERDFSLDSVCEDEIGVQKIENPYDSFKEFYQNDFPLFVEYNIRDVDLLVQLDEKRKFLNLTYTIAYLVGMNYSDVFGTVMPWDIFIQNSLKLKGIFVPTTVDRSSENRKIMGGFVMKPNPGLRKWLVSIDADSLYPSAIRTWNISPETLVQPEDVPDELLPWFNRIQIDELIEGDPKLTKLLKKHKLTMTANGQFFRTDKQGIMAELTSNVYEGRVRAKSRSKELLKQAERETDPSRKRALADEAAALDSEQYALKILLNSLYGAFANEHFRFFDLRMAEGITTTGQFFIRRVGERVSAWIDKLSGNKDSLIYIDTDSVVGETKIYYNNQEMTIADAFSLGGDVEVNDDVTKNYVISPKATTLTYDPKTKQVVERDIRYIMKHRVKKEMFKITVDGKEVVCTEDHSLVVKRGRKIIKVSPREVVKGDKFLYIDKEKFASGN